MTRTTWVVALCAFVLVLAAAGIAIVAARDSPGTAAVAFTTTPATTPTPTRSASPSPSRVVTPTSTSPAADVTSVIATAVLPKPSASYAAATPPVKLSAICAGAVLDLDVGVESAFTSLETTKDPLRFLDVAIGVYGDSDSAQAAYTVLTGEIADCPTTRSVTPTPTGGQTGEPVTIQGAAQSATLAGQAAVQWVQLQTSTAPATSLRTSVTLFLFHNAIVAVSMDEDSESVAAADLSEASRTSAEAILKALESAVA